MARSTRELERQQSESFQGKARPREDYENPIASIEEDTSEKDTNSDEDKVREPPAKRRSISPEEEDVNTAPSPSRTRSGRVYYPVMTSTYQPVSQNTRATSNVEQQSVENLASKITISAGKQSQHTSDYHRLRSRDQMHKRQQDKSRYSLGRSLSPASSTLGSPLTQSPSATHTGEPRFPNSLGSPSHHQTYKPQTPPDTPNNNPKKDLTPNKSGKGKAVDTAPLHPPGSSSRTIMTATSVEQSVESERMNRKNEMCIDPSTMPSALPRASQINLNPAIPQNYRSPQIESDSEEAPPNRVDNCFIPKLLQENLKDLSSRNSGRAHEDSDEDLAPAQSSEKTPHRPTGAFSSRYNSRRFDATVRKQNSWSAPREEGNQRNSEPCRASYGDSDKNEYANHLVDGVVYRVPNHRLENSAYKPYGGGINQDYSSKACQQYSSGDDSHHTNATPSPQRRPTRPQSSSQYPKQEMISEATEADARKHRIPPGYSLKNWNPLEEPIMLLGSVFDANNLGKWINDWTIYYHGPATALADMAGEIWRLLTELASKVKRAEECMPQIRMAENREMVNEFIESRERLIDKLKKLLTSCEISMLKARERYGKDLGYSSKNAEMEFIDSMFGRDTQLEATEKFMASMRLWNLRFDANCEDILRRPEQ